MFNKTDWKDILPSLQETVFAVLVGFATLGVLIGVASLAQRTNSFTPPDAIIKVSTNVSTNVMTNYYRNMGVER